jgi:hypothetical protein
MHGKFSGIAKYDFDWNLKNTSRVEDEKANSLLHQWAPRLLLKQAIAGELVVRVTLPPFGYRQIRVMQGEPLHS